MNVILVEVITQGILPVHIWLPPPQKGLDTSFPSPGQKSPVLLSSPATPCPAKYSPTKPCITIHMVVHLFSPLPESLFHELKGPPAHCPASAQKDTPSFFSDYGDKKMLLREIVSKF